MQNDIFERLAFLREDFLEVVTDKELSLDARNSIIGPVVQQLDNMLNSGRAEGDSGIVAQAIQEFWTHAVMNLQKISDIPALENLRDLDRGLGHILNRF